MEGVKVVGLRDVERKVDGWREEAEFVVGLFVVGENVAGV